MSHPSWVRGLKPPACRSILLRRRSHPSWVRGLKQDMYGRIVGFSKVAPFMGAWIETIPVQ